MAKYPEGSVSPRGTMIVRGGQWVPIWHDPVIRGAMERNAQANAMGPGGDPRLQAAQQVNMERATDAGIAMAPVAGAAMGLPVAAAGLRALGAGRAALPLAGALMDAGPELLKGDVPGAAFDAARGWVGGKTVGALLGGAQRFLGAAAPAALSEAQIAARGTIASAERTLAAHDALVKHGKEGLEALAKNGSAEAKAAIEQLASKGAKWADEALGRITKPAAQTVSSLMRKGLPEGPEAMKAVADHIVEWRTKFKMSGPQIVNALREQYGIAAKEGNVIARQVIASLQD